MISSRPLAVFVCALAALTASCGKREPAPIVIGLNLELTGDIQAIGESAKNAAELFFEQQNSAGGIELADGPHRFRPIISDNGADATQAAAIAQRLIARDGATALVGPNSGNCANAAAEIAEALKCVMVSPWSADPVTTMDRVAGVPKRYVFRAGADDKLQGSVMARFALSRLGARKAAIVSVNAPGAAAQAAGFKDAFTAGGGEVAGQETFDAGDADFSALANAVAAGTPDAVFLAAGCDDALPFLEASKNTGLAVNFLGTELWNSPQTIRMTALGLDGLYFCKNFDQRDADPAATRFIEAYTAKYGKAPDDVAALTYDACALIAEALKNAGKNDREALREQLARLRGFAGAAGTYEFKPGSGDPLKSMPVMQIKSSGLQWVGDFGP